MTASLHLVHHEPRGVLQALRATRRHWPALKATPGLRVARVFALAELDTMAGGTPAPARWGLWLGWDTAQARDAALAGGSAPAPFADGARERWDVSLDTVRVSYGSFAGWVPSTEGVERLDRHEPVAVLTYGRVRPRYLWAFTRDNRRIVRELAATSGHTWRLGLFDHPVARGTFTLWRSQGEMVRFSYGTGTVHKPVQREAMAVPWSDSFFFARFRPVASSGTWAGVDPLAGLRALAPS